MAEITTTPTSDTPGQVNIHWVFGVLAALFIFVAIATYSSRMAKDAPDYDSHRRAERLDILQKQREADEKALTTADWIDQTKGTVRIPIDEAIPEAITALKAKPVQAGAGHARRGPDAAQHHSCYGEQRGAGRLAPGTGHKRATFHSARGCRPE